MTSTNGTDWFSQTSAADNAWQSVTYGTVNGVGTFVAVSSDGNQNRVMTSDVSPPAFTITSSSETRTVNTAATGFTANSTGGPFGGFTINATPPGMSFNTTTGALTGTPNTVAAATTYTVTATNASGSTTRTFTLTVTAALAAPAFTLSASTESRTVNTAATGFTANSTGGAIASFAISATPPGMSFNTTTGALTGTPSTVAPATTYTVTATNASGSTTQTFVLTVTAAVIDSNNPLPPPVQISSISSCQAATGPTTGGSTYSISGSFVTPIFNVQVGGEILPQSSWVQTPTSVTITMPINAAGVVPIIIYNGQVPLLDGCQYTYVTPTSTQVTTPKSVQPLASSLKLRVFFRLSSSKITSAEKIKLKTFSAKIAGLGNKITITVTGYAQPTPGSEKTDGALAKARAAAVASYLRQAGVDTNVMYAGAGRAAINRASSRFVQILANNN
jgi:flagellar motor protein MotB